jgi:hypothetical protein
MLKVLQTIAQYGQRDMHCGDSSSGSSAWDQSRHFWPRRPFMSAMPPIATQAVSRSETMCREANICAAPLFDRRVGAGDEGRRDGDPERR